MNLLTRFWLSLGLIVVSAAAGYLVRTRGAIRESVAGPIMTAVTVGGYPLVGVMAIWGMPLKWSDAWLPLLGAVQATLMALIALAMGRKLFADRAERGVVGICCGIGNHGVTMAGFVVYLLFGREGLGLNTIHGMYTLFAVVLLSYTIAQRHAPVADDRSILRLMLGSLLHWRAAGLYACVAAIALTGSIAPPRQFQSWHLLDIAIYVLIAAVYFAIGLRLHLPHVVQLRRAVLFVIGIRHGVGLLLGLALVGMTWLSPLPMEGMSLKVFLIQSSVSVGVFGVTVPSMFRMKPREAAAIFVVSSVVYLVAGMPLVLWIFSA